MAEHAYRADIDGLRAVAVLAVVAFHANPKLAPGGFVGVDVFFVISGFLIARLILNALEAGSFSFFDFYARRIRRLFPALLVVLLAVWGFGWFLMLPADYAALGRYMAAGGAFAANILTYSEIGYFDAPASSKPLLHLWSLGVEEQFYFVFPALLVWAWRAQTVRRSLVLIGLASFLANIALVEAYPSFCFYLPMTRFWEFVVGALLAYGEVQRALLGWPAPSPLRAPAWRNSGAVAGLLLLLAAIIRSPSASFPGWWAAPPVLGAFLIIAAGPRAWLNRAVLANPALVFVGLFSYPLYLWHWPLLLMARAFLRRVYPDSANGNLVTMAIVAAAFVLSWSTYRFVELPVRARRPPISARRLTLAAFASVALVALLGLATASSGILARYPLAAQALLTPLTYRADFPPEDSSRNKAGPLVVAYGDSHADHLMAGLLLLQRERTFRVRMVGWQACAPVGVAWGLALKPGEKERCRAVTAKNEALLETLKPDIVVLSALWRQYDHVERLAETLRFMQRIGVPRIVVIGPAPFWPESPQSLMFAAYQADPQHHVPERMFGFDSQTPKSDRQVREIVASAGAIYISTFDTFCNESGCLVRLGDSAKDIVQVDYSHFSAAGSWFLISHAAEQIFG